LKDIDGTYQDGDLDRDEDSDDVSYKPSVSSGNSDGGSTVDYEDDKHEVRGCIDELEEIRQLSPLIGRRMDRHVSA